MDLFKCPKCKGNLVDDHGRPWCPNCGEVTWTPQERRKYYQEHKEEMVRDLIAHGKDFVVNKWRIKPQVIGHLKRLPEYKEAYPGRPKVSPNGIPPLPAFQDKWAPEVQVKWLEVYEKVTGLKEVHR